MGLREHLKAPAPVTRAELEKLRGEFAAFKRVVALGFMAAEESAKYPGVHGGPGSARLRLEKIAAVAEESFGLVAAEVEELRGFLQLVEQARDGERQREFEENQRNSGPPATWTPDGRYARRIPGR